MSEKVSTVEIVDQKTLLKAFRLMSLSKAMADVYDINRPICYYVHANSRGHEAIQLAVGMQLTEEDYVSPYYRDDAILMGAGFTPYELMLQLLAKKEDPFSGGRSYYSHTSSDRKGFPKMIHQSSATGMQAIPTTGIAQGILYMEKQGLTDESRPLVVCSMGDGSVTEGEVSEAFQFATLKKLPVVFLVQDNNWGISVSREEARTNDAYEYAGGFKGLKRFRVDGSDFVESYQKVRDIFDLVRNKRVPVLLHASVPLLGHHTSGVRKDMYRTDEDLAKHSIDDPYPKLKNVLLDYGVEEAELEKIQDDATKEIEYYFQQAADSPEPDPEMIMEHEFAPAPIKDEVGLREPEDSGKIIMVDAALHAMTEILEDHPEALFYGQDVGRRLGGVFREAAMLAEKYGDERVFNTAIQEAYLIGSTAGMSATGAKPIVEIQFADYFWPGMNQLVSELSKSCYLTNGKYPVQSLIRVPIGAYGSGGPYHSGSIESTLLTIRGIKVVYPSNAADIKGLLKGAFLDPNPVVMLEHKGLYWSKVPGTGAAKTIEPDRNYVVPLGKARTVQEADPNEVNMGNSLVVITYGMGVHWALNASTKFPGSIEILDLRTLNPLDEEAMYEAVRRHGKCLVLTEEPILNSFAESLAGRISQECFQYLDAPVATHGALNLPAVPLNSGLERTMLPSAEKVAEELERLLSE